MAPILRCLPSIRAAGRRSAHTCHGYKNGAHEVHDSPWSSPFFPDNVRSATDFNSSMRRSWGHFDKHQWNASEARRGWNRASRDGHFDWMAWQHAARAPPPFAGSEKHRGSSESASAASQPNPDNSKSDCFFEELFRSAFSSRQQHSPWGRCGRQRNLSKSSKVDLSFNTIADRWMKNAPHMVRGARHWMEPEIMYRRTDMAAKFADRYHLHSSRPSKHDPNERHFHYGAPPEPPEAPRSPFGHRSHSWHHRSYRHHHHHRHHFHHRFHGPWRLKKCLFRMLRFLFVRMGGRFSFSRALHRYGMHRRMDFRYYFLRAYAIDKRRRDSWKTMQWRRMRGMCHMGEFPRSRKQMKEDWCWRVMMSVRPRRGLRLKAPLTADGARRNNEG
jgi:hypothetical protein